eukprot:1663384-Alexandrium_andersonii.AAC.1
MHRSASARSKYYYVSRFAGDPLASVGAKADAARQSRGVSNYVTVAGRPRAEGAAWSCLAACGTGA